MPLFILAIISTMLLADAWWWWRADRLLRGLPRARLLRAVLAAFMAGCIGGLGVAIASRFSLTLRDSVGPALLAGLFIWHFITLPVVAIPSLLHCFALRLLNVAWPKQEDPSAMTRQASVPVTEDRIDASLPHAESPRTLSRRQLLGAALVGAPPLFTVGSTLRAMEQLDEFRVRRITVPLDALPRDLDGVTIAHVSDIHIGTFTRGRTLQRIIAATNGLRADLVMQTGDLINHSLNDLPAGIDMTLKMEGRFGQFMCEGNHDLIESRAEFERRTQAASLPMLINRSDEVRVRGVPVQILGLRWGGVAGAPVRTNGRDSDAMIQASMGQLLQERRDDAFSILLAHHPHAFDSAAKAGIPLTLSGHTHGGQLQLSSKLGFGPMMYRYWSGLYTRQKSTLVVSNGVGNWFPLRIHAPAEIVHITLRRA